MNPQLDPRDTNSQSRKAKPCGLLGLVLCQQKRSTKTLSDCPFYPFSQPIGDAEADSETTCWLEDSERVDQVIVVNQLPIPWSNSSLDLILPSETENPSAQLYNLLIKIHFIVILKIMEWKIKMIKSACKDSTNVYKVLELRCESVNLIDE